MSSPHGNCRRPLTLVLVSTLGSWAVPAPAQIAPGHHLPPGPERPVRERQVDVLRLRHELRIDLTAQRVTGSVTLRLAPLRTGLSELVLDAAGLEVSQVSGLSGAGAARLAFEVDPRALRVRLPTPLVPGQEIALRVDYAARPGSGLYFFPASARGGPQAWSYGEGGLHYGWLPLYNDTNDRFAVEALLTVAKPFVALANGTLRETRDNPDGTRTFHWLQEEPIPNYLLALDIGEFERVSLGEIQADARRVPVGVWGPAGTGEPLSWTFRNTPRMVEFFSQRFGRPYAWPKYDQIVLREFEGAMETTGLVGFTESYVRRQQDPVDSSPDLGRAHPIWSTEDTIAHELAHHWFGDLVTCRSLGSLWLNESFATFAHTLWTGHDRGEDDLTYQRWRYLNAYLDYVRHTGTVRPMEYLRYEAPEDMYQEETTYLKGALVLHMLRHAVGDADFDRSLAVYLERHAFGEVDSADLLVAFQRATGRNLAWFFDDWIVGGGGHPVFDVAWSWSSARQQVDLTVRQLQADRPFENAFHLPLELEVVTASGRTTHAIEVDGWTTQVSLPVPEKPVAVTFDKGGWAVAEVRFPRPLGELRVQLTGGGLSERLRAVRQLADDFARHPESVAALVSVLADRSAHWGLRQEAALGLGRMGGEPAVEALVAATADADRRVRRAVALGLGEARGPRALAALERLVESDAAEDVVAVAASGLGRAGGPTAAGFLERQLSRDSWWNVIRLGALQGLAELRDASLVPVFREHTDPRFERPLRLAALDGWQRATPDDPALAARLRELAHDRNRSVRQAALAALGGLHREQDRAFLEAYARDEPDPTLARDARTAAEEIAAFARQ